MEKLKVKEVEVFLGHVDEYVILLFENKKVAVLRDGRKPKRFRNLFWAMKYINWVEFWGILRDTLRYCILNPLRKS